jgi:conjugal transfer/entry exclusion protein
MMQSVQEHKSLWRIINDYREDAEGDENLLAFWDQLATQKADQVAALQQLIAERSTPEALAEGADEADEVEA